MHNWMISSARWRFLIAVLLVLGIFFRFVNLDRKIYWFDETYTSLRVSGYTEQEVIGQVFDGSIISVEDLLKYQHTNPEKNLANTIESLAKEDAQHGPLYYIIVRLWVQWLGNSPAVTRSLSALISLLVFPCIYWLCLELFESPIVGWTAVALIAVSPFHVLYAQEAREYSLWTVTILLSSAALLRAMRLKTKASWGTYAAMLALSLYTFLFTGLVALGHGIYVGLTERFRLTKISIAYLLSSLAGLLAFLPWLLVVINGFFRIQKTTSYLNQKMSLLGLVSKIAVRPGYAFVDLNPYSPELKLTISLILQSFLNIIVLIIVLYSIYFLCSKSYQRGWLFNLTLIGSTFLTLLVADLMLGGLKSTINRYLVPYFLGIQLSVAYLFAARLTSKYEKIQSRKLWQLSMITLLSCGVISCAISSQSIIWWNKGPNYYNPYLAHIINQTEHPLVVSDDRTHNKPLANVIGDIISLTYMLEPKVRLQLVVEPNLPKIPDGCSDVFLFNPSKVLRNGLEKQNYKLKLLYEKNRPNHTSFWKLEVKQ